MEKKKSKDGAAARASLTPEAAVVMGLVLLVLAGVTVLGLWMRDRCLAAAETRLKIEANRELPGLKRSAAEDTAWLAAQGTGPEVSVSKGSGTGHAALTAGRLWPGLPLSCELSVDRTFPDPVDLLRKARLIGTLGE